MSPGFYLLYVLIVLLCIIYSQCRKANNRKELPLIHDERERLGYKKILYLRSFRLDGKGIQAGSMDIFEDLNLIPVELELAKGLLRLKVQLIAVGKPSEQIPEIGFNRKYFDDDKWRPAVLEYIEESSLIIYRPDSSDAVFWEIQQIFAGEFESKIAIWADMGYGTDYKLNGIRYKIFARKVFERFVITLPEYNRWSVWLGLNENNEWTFYRTITALPAYQAMVNQL